MLGCSGLGLRRLVGNGRDGKEPGLGFKVS